MIATVDHYVPMCTDRDSTITSNFHLLWKQVCQMWSFCHGWRYLSKFQQNYHTQSFYEEYTFDFINHTLAVQYYTVPRPWGVPYSSSWTSSLVTCTGLNFHPVYSMLILGCESTGQFSQVATFVPCRFDGPLAEYSSESQSKWHHTLKSLHVS